MKSPITFVALRPSVSATCLCGYGLTTKKSVEAFAPVLEELKR